MKAKLLRMPIWIFDDLQERAKKDCIPLNSLILMILSGWLKEEEQNRR